MSVGLDDQSGPDRHCLALRRIWEWAEDLQSKGVLAEGHLVTLGEMCRDVREAHAPTEESGSEGSEESGSELEDEEDRMLAEHLSSWTVERERVLAEAEAAEAARLLEPRDPIWEELDEDQQRAHWLHAVAFAAADRAERESPTPPGTLEDRVPRKNDLCMAIHGDRFGEVGTLMAIENRVGGRPTGVLEMLSAGESVFCALNVLRVWHLVEDDSEGD